MVGYQEYRMFNEVIDKHFKGKKLFNKEEIMFIITEMTDIERYTNSSKKKPSSFKVFKYFVRYCLFRNLANFDTLILLTGDKGVGKSSFAIMLGKYWCKLLGIRFDPNKFIAYTTAQMEDKIDNLERFMPLIGDESVNFCTSENWSKKENKHLKLKLAQIRTKHFFFILCFPLKITKVDKTYLDSYVNYWIDLFSRGRGALYVRSLSPALESWRITDFKELGNYNEFTSAEEVAKKLSKHPNFWYLITAPKPSEQLYKRYLAVRERNVYNQNNAMSLVSKQDIYQALLIKILQDIMMRDSSVSMKRLLIFIKDEYDFEIKESDIKAVIEEANQLLEKVKEEGKRKEYVDERNDGNRTGPRAPEEATPNI